MTEGNLGLSLKSGLMSQELIAGTVEVERFGMAQPTSFTICTEEREHGGEPFFALAVTGFTG
jgi:hypothetical protein